MGQSAILNNWTFAVNTGITSFQGEMSQSDWKALVFDNNRMGWGGYFTKHLTPFCGIGIQLIDSKTTGASFYSGEKKPDAYFTSNLFEYNLFVNVNLLHWLLPDNHQFLNRVNMNVMAGVGKTISSSKYYIINQETDRYTLNAQSHQNSSLTLPVTLELTINLDENIALTASHSHRYLSYEYIDFLNQNTHRDLYTYSAIGLRYRIGGEYTYKRIRSGKSKLLNNKNTILNF